MGSSQKPEIEKYPCMMKPQNQIGGKSMEDICKKDYAGFLEETLNCLVEMPIDGLCIIGKMKGGDIFVNYSNFAPIVIPTF